MKGLKQRSNIRFSLKKNLSEIGQKNTLESCRSSGREVLMEEMMRLELR